MTPETIQRWWRVNWVTNALVSAGESPSQESMKKHPNGSITQQGVSHTSLNGYSQDAHLIGPLTNRIGGMTEELHATPIAVIGMSFRLPRGLESAESFWEALSEGRSTWSTFPESRLHFDGVYDPDEERLNGVSILN